MKLDELKYHIVNNEILPNLLIFKCRKDSTNSKFLFHQYLKKYVKDNDFTIVQEDEITENVISLFDTLDNNIYIYDIPKFDFYINDNKKYCWVLCNTISKKCQTKYANNIIELPKIDNWMIKDYIDFNLPNLLAEYKDKLYNVYNKDLFRLESEISKLTLLSENNINSWYKTIENQLFVDSTEFTIFDITNCIINRDKSKLIELKNNINSIDIDPFGFVTILLNNFRQIIDIQLAKNPTPEYVGISNKHFWAIKNYSCNHYSKEELVYIYKFLLSLDMDIKSGHIPIEIVVDYIISKIMLLGDLE